jgi:Fur family ferric uptake transcriptional regulator
MDIFQEGAMQAQSAASNTMPLAAVLTELERQGHKATGPRRQIIALLAEQASAVTAAELYTHLREQAHNTGLVTVYRTLELLAECGLAHHLIQEDRPNHEIRYILCTPRQEHHHHLICTRCGHVESISACMLAPLEREVARSSGYHIQRHTLELFGLCPSCQK